MDDLPKAIQERIRIFNTVSRLAEELNVSETEIRGAAAELIAQNLIEEVPGKPDTYRYKLRVKTDWQ